jgi:hypothetical protein
MQAFWNRSNGDRGVEAALRRHRPEPRDQFVRELVHRISGSPRAVRLYAFSRLSFAAALTVLIFGSFGSFGGLGYAATSAEQAADAVKSALIPKKQKRVKVVKSSAAQTQYPREVLPAEETIVVRGARRAPSPPASPPVSPLAAAPEREELPFTGLALGTTFALAILLMGLGAALRRMARTRGAAVG